MVKLGMEVVMDTSEEYLKMVDCPEIQEGHQWERGDFMEWADDTYEVFHEDVWENYLVTRPHRWFPRQDQLQEMVSDSNILRLIKDFCEFADPWNSLGVMPHKRAMHEAEKEAAYLNQFTSMEQLWLAFVMKERHQKTWDGTNWR